MPATTVSKLIYEIIWDDSDAKKKADAWDRKLQESAKSVGSAFSGAFTSAIGIAEKALSSLSDGIIAIGKDSIALEDALTGVKRTANLNAEQVSILTSAVRDLSSEQLRGAVSAQELGAILEVAGQRGELAGDRFEETLQGALQFTQQIATASAALDLSFQKTADALGKLQGPYGESSVAVGNLANAVNVLADSTRAAAPSIIEISQRAAPALAALGLSQGDLIGLAGAIDALGVSSYTGATALQTAFKKMTAETDAFAEAFGINAEELNRLVQEDIGAAFQLLLQHIQKMATETPAGTQKVAQALKDLGVSGAGVSTALLGLASMGTELETKFLNPANEGLTNMDSINKEFINSISKVSQLWDSLGTIMMNTFGVIGDALLPILRELLQEVNEQAIAFRKWFVESEFISDILPGVIQEIRQGISELIPKVVELVKNMDWDQLFRDAKDAWDGLVVVGKAFFAVVTEHLPSIIKGFESLLKAIKPVIQIIKGSMDVMMAPINAINDGILKILGNIEKLGISWDSVFQGMLGWIDKGMSALGALSSKLGEVISKLWETEEASHGHSVWPEMVQWIDKASMSTDAMKSRLGEVTTALQRMEAIRSVPGMQTASQIIDTQRQQRMLAGEQTQLQANIAQQERQAQTQAPINVTLMMDNQEVGRLVDITDDARQQKQQRSFGGGSGGFRSSGGGW